MTSSEPRILHDRYRLLSPLGVGGMGSVWLAEDQQLERQVALKELLHHVSAAGLEERRTRAMREAKAMARVRHPSIVPIFDVFIDHGDPWIVMEHIRGRSLAQIIEDHHALDEPAIARIGSRVLSGLRAAHRAQVFHRDVKPANILVADDSAFLVDFGIAKIAGDMGLTGRSSVLGTTEFIAPERLLGREATAASDLWSLGVTFFCALEGYSPFARGGERSQAATTAAILHDDPPPPSKPGRLADVVQRLLRKDLRLRPTAAELADVLAAIGAGPAQAPRPTTGPGPAQGRYSGPTHSAPFGLPQAGRGPGGAAVPSAGSPARPSPGIGAARQSTQLHAARAAVRDADPAIAAGQLGSIGMEDAARMLADCPHGRAAQIIQAMAPGTPRRARVILQHMPSRSAGRAVSRMNSGVAAALLGVMPVRETARILESADERAAGAVIMAFPADIAAELVKAMTRPRAQAILPHVEPATVAKLLTAAGNLHVLRHLNAAFRAQVARHLPGER